MNSGNPAEPNRELRTNWILTTCRGRVAHLRESLPSWLHHLRDWAPLVVCCDDREAFEYASGELRLANKGAVVYVEQGEYFSRLEAIRTGVRALLCGIQSNGDAHEMTALEPHYYENATIGGQIALLDADTVALCTTAQALAKIDRYDSGIVMGGIRDDMGFLICHGDAMRSAFDLIEPGTFNGYGFDDNAIRVGVWLACGGRMYPVRQCWARRLHSDRERTAYHAKPMGPASQLNGLALGALIAKHVPRADWEAVVKVCLEGQKVRICA